MAASSPIVLVHGAFQSAATWDLVAPRLRAAGRHVIVAALTGLEPGGEALTEAVTLDTHVQDVVSLLGRETLADVTLVGHSYAGMIVTGVAEHAADRIARLIYVDALVPEHGQSAMDLLPEPTRRGFLQRAEDGGGWRMRPDERLLDLWGLEHGPAREFVHTRMTDFSLRCFSEPVKAGTRAAHRLPRAYVASVKPGYPIKTVFEPFAARARQEGWAYYELETGHDAQAEMPDALAGLLLDIPA